LFVAGGLALGLIGAIWLTTQVGEEGRMQSGGALIGAFALAILVLPLLGFGVAMLARSGREEMEDEERGELRKILDVVKSRGQLQISELVIELGSTRREVQNQIHSLVGMGLFSGYINWDEGTLYSEEAGNIRELDRCKVCGGEVDFAGKGVLACQHCGTEYFLN
jgi:hypothetical protein